MNKDDLVKYTDAFKELDNLYKSLEKIDALGNIKKISLIGSEGKSDVQFDGSVKNLIFDQVRVLIREMIKKYEENFLLTEISVPAIIKTISKNHFSAMAEKGWEHTYWFFDIHGTILYPTNDVKKISNKYYPGAKEVLQNISKIPSIKMCLYSCSHPKEMETYMEFFKKDGINFIYSNTNPEVKNGGYGFYENKPYMNVLFEDKAGFDPLKDWFSVKEFLKFKKIWID